MKTVKTQIRAYSGRHSANFTSFFGDQRTNGMPSESGATAKSNIIGDRVLTKGQRSWERVLLRK